MKSSRRSRLLSLSQPACGSLLGSSSSSLSFKFLLFGYFVKTLCLYNKECGTGFYTLRHHPCGTSSWHTYEMYMDLHLNTTLGFRVLRFRV